MMETWYSPANVKNSSRVQPSNLAAVPEESFPNSYNLTMDSRSTSRASSPSCIFRAKANSCGNGTCMLEAVMRFFDGKFMGFELTLEVFLRPVLRFVGGLEPFGWNPKDSSAPDTTRRERGRCECGAS